MKTGTRVQYSRAFLRSLHITNGELPFIEGTITQYPYVTESGKVWEETCRVLWDGDDDSKGCRIVNLVPTYKKHHLEG